MMDIRTSWRNKMAKLPYRKLLACFIAGLILTLSLTHRGLDLWALSWKKQIVYAAAGTFLAGVVCFALYGHLRRWLSGFRRAIWIILIVLAATAGSIAALRTLALPSIRHTFEITTDLIGSGVQESVNLLEIRDSETGVVPLDVLKHDGEWTVQGNQIISGPETDASLRYYFKSKSDSTVNVLFNTHPNGGAVNIALDGEVIQHRDLREDPGGNTVEVIEIVNPVLPSVVRVLIYSLDLLAFSLIALISLYLVHGALRGLWIIIGALVSGYEFTARLQKIILDRIQVKRRFLFLIWVFWSWVVFGSTLWIAKDILRSMDLISAREIFWQDVVLTYGLVGFLSAIESFLYALLLTGIAILISRIFKNEPGVEFSKSIIVTFLLVVWFNMLYWVLYTNLPASFTDLLQNMHWSIYLAACIAILVIVLLRKVKILAWFDETTPHILLLSQVLAGFYLVSAILLLTEPLSTKKPDLPITLPEASNPLPNVIYIVVDALGAQDMSLYGYSLETTPRLKETLQGWTIYDNFQTAANCTHANMPSVLTGRYPYFEHSEEYGNRSRSEKGWLNLLDVLNLADYETVWYGYLSPAFYHFTGSFDRTICHNASSPYSYLNQTRFRPRALPLDINFPLVLSITQIYREVDGTCETIPALQTYLKQKESAADADPFFIYFHYIGVHGPGYPSGKYLGAFLPIEEGLVGIAGQNPFYAAYDAADQENVDKLRLRYDEAILNWDEQIALMVEQLQQLSFYDNSMIIISADHGQTFDNGFTSHCTPILSYTETHVPLFIKYPYQQDSKRITGLTSTVDLTPTILDTVGIGYPASWVDGYSLLQEDAWQENRIIFSRKPKTSIYAVLKGSNRFLQHSQYGDYLFDIEKDPAEKQSLLPQTAAEEQQKWKSYLHAYDNRLIYLNAGGAILDAPPLP
jgi:arylsulfatase A-like enzyme